MVETSTNARMGFFFWFDNENHPPLHSKKPVQPAYVTLIMVTLCNRTIAAYCCQRILKEYQKTCKTEIDCSHKCQRYSFFCLIIFLMNDFQAF